MADQRDWVSLNFQDPKIPINSYCDVILSKYFAIDPSQIKGKKDNLKYRLKLRSIKQYKLIKQLIT